MSGETCLEDLTVNLVVEFDESLVGINFSGDTSKSAFLRGVTLNIGSAGDAATKDIVGVYATGNQAGDVFAKSSFNTMQRSTVNVVSNSTGKVRALELVGKVNFQVRDCIFYATGTSPAADVIGVEVVSDVSGYGFVNLKTSTVSGSTYDISQPSLTSVQNSAIQLNATDLQNASSLNGFTVNTEPSHFFFGLGSRVNFTGSGSEVTTTAGTYYLHTGSQIANFSTAVVGLSFVQKVIVFEGIAYCNTNITDGTTLTIDFTKSSSSNTLGTSFATLVVNSANPLVKFQNKAMTFNPTSDFLHVRCVISSGSLVAGNDVVVAVGVY